MNRDASDYDNHLEFGIVTGPLYSSSHRRLGSLRYAERNFLEAIYHFSESHAVGLKQSAVLEKFRSNTGLNDSEDLSFEQNDEKSAVEGMIKRLEELPKEWTIVQLTREFDPIAPITLRKSGKSPKLKSFFLSRLPCGQELKNAMPVITKCSWPDDIGYDVIEEFLKIKEKLGSTKKGIPSHIRKIRLEASNDLEKYCSDVGHICFKEWVCLLLGKLYSKSFEEEIRKAVDNRLEGNDVSRRERYLCYLIAEGCYYLENSELEVALYQVFDKNETLAIRVLETLVRIKEDLGGRLHVAKRHPVLLILDDHLDIISWESLPFLKRHPVSRIYSLHFAHSLHSAHKNHIKNGVREIDETDVCYYIINPDGNLPDSQERISKFVKKRFPNWIGIIGKKPTEVEITKALTESNCNVFMYCGHGSGAQYIRAEMIQRLNVKPLQLLYGCNSLALKDHGGLTEMYSDVMEFAIAKSGCTIGMLWPVTSSDTDQITMALANVCLPGTPIDMQTFEPLEKDSIKKEPELLRAIREVRECVRLYSNGAALIARGIPIKLVQNSKN